ncbi:sugar transferase [Geomonas paludis]|uniref:Bacterial sugar transferase domain-containing protein n=1 Tax=Geomonas paludis TaxID=2740185 RepID=A0A6V8MVR7_9BACT|nr:sugar transferase [Geomonas paludis]GFO63827.1 hypothetical protein GMPD_17460 [Geomonas paludis]
MSAIPLIQNVKLRTLLGLLLLAAAVVYAGSAFNTPAGATGIVLCLSWAVSVVCTDKYVHKYPQRYYSYLAASHAKAAAVMAVPAAAAAWLAGPATVPPEPALVAFAVFCVGDLLLSSFCRRRTAPAVAPARAAAVTPAAAAAPAPPLSPVDRDGVLAGLPATVAPALRDLIAAALPDEPGGSELLLVGPELSAHCEVAPGGTVNFICCLPRINDIRRINRFLRSCIGRLEMGGYLAASYTPIETAPELRPGRAGYLLDFLVHRALPKTPYLNSVYFSLTRGRNRMLSKVEVWGRLSYFGLHVVAEQRVGDRVFLVARRNLPPSQNPRPSYYPVVALEKVGLDGEIVRLHKVRSMYPFSEFLQKRIFEDNGLASTGKFANDFRLTEYGNFIRRYWIDELPQIWDWLRGDIKLVGMRATSRHYLSLYPQELYDLYIQIKPGLIPPIFDEKTDSFDRIVEVEMAYLTSYMKSPLKTDVGLFFRTFTDIFFRGVRSK